MTGVDSTFSWLCAGTGSASFDLSGLDRAGLGDPPRRLITRDGASDERRGRKGEQHLGDRSDLAVLS